MSVSYTHLDVYKRQVVYRLPYICSTPYVKTYKYKYINTIHNTIHKYKYKNTHLPVATAGSPCVQSISFPSVERRSSPLSAAEASFIPWSQSRILTCSVGRLPSLQHRFDDSSSNNTTFSNIIVGLDTNNYIRTGI